MDLLEDIKLLKSKEGNKLSENSTKWLLDKLKNPNDVFKAIRLNKILIGKFYFILYDLQGKTSKMEQYSPMLIVDFRNQMNKKLVYGISVNFIPKNIRILFFNSLLKNYDQEKNRPIKINFKIAFNLLDSIGFQYCIRELDASLINKVYEIDASAINRFLTIDTYPITNVDEKKLAEIWLSKLKKREESLQKRISELITDYSEISKTFEKQMKDYKKEFENIQDSKDHLNNLLK